MWSTLSQPQPGRQVFNFLSQKDGRLSWPWCWYMPRWFICLKHSSIQVVASWWRHGLELFNRKVWSFAIMLPSDAQVDCWCSCVHSSQPMKVPLPSENVVVRHCRCGYDGSALITDVASVLACGNNEYNKLGLNQRQGFLMSMKNMFNKVWMYDVAFVEDFQPFSHVSC